jgi:hypothetical protein
MAGARVINIPASAITFFRPDKKGSLPWRIVDTPSPPAGYTLVQGERDAYTVSFPGEMPAEEVLRAFQNSMVRPTFSLRTAIRSHLLSTVAGGLLFLVGLLGLLLLIWQAFKKTAEDYCI